MTIAKPLTLAFLKNNLMLKKILAPIFFLSVISTSCKKSSSCDYSNPSQKASASEISAVAAIAPSGALQDPSGVFYTIDIDGAGATPTICSTVSVTYSGRLTNGNVFDASSSGISFMLGQLIIGWQYGIQKMKKGATATLYIPPSLGYGSSPQYDRYGNVSIPANSILIFTIHLIDVQ